MKTVSIILACKNEQETLPIYFKAVDPIIKSIKDYAFDFIMVNDGSTDNTAKVMNDIYKKRNDVTIISFSKNFGQNPGIFAAFKQNKSDYVITMDCDLQDPVSLIKDICDKFTEGYEIVNPHRGDRKNDSWLKRTTAGMFYKVINKLEKKEAIPSNVNAYRGLSKRAVDEINKMSETDRLFMPTIPLVGFKSCEVDYVRGKRVAGKTNFNTDKLVTYALDNISVATSRPLFLASKFGVITSIIFFLSSLALLICYILGLCQVMPAYSAITVFMIISFVFLAASVVITFVGINGLYEHNILINTRNRPMYVIDYIRTQQDKQK